MEPYRTTDPEGGVTGYSYDSEGKLTGIAYPDGSSEMYVYDERGRLIIHIDREGNKSVRLYDPERPHLVSGFIDETGGLTEFTYDSHGRSEEHTSELQSRQYLVCRLLLEKKNNKTNRY